MVQSITSPPSDKCLTTGSSTDNMNASAIDESNEAFNHMPLSELSRSTRQQLALMLNRKKVLRSEEGHERDWRGLATLARQRGLFDENTDNPIEKLLFVWTKNSPQNAKVGYLVNYLGTIDRWDVCDDIHENLVRDKETYDAKIKRQVATEQQETVDKVDSAVTLNKYDQLPVKTYDALVLYADADIDLAIDIMNNLETHKKHKFKVFLKDRDMLGGVSFEHTVLTSLIERRCRHLIIVFTKEFLHSPLNSFLVNCTQSMQIRNNQRKIIPISYEENISVPVSLSIYTHLKFKNTFFNFWDKLVDSLLDTQQLSQYSSFNTEALNTLQIPTAPSIDNADRSEKYQAAVPLQQSPPRIAINDQICRSQLELHSIDKFNDKVEFEPNNNKISTSKKYRKLGAAHSMDVLNTQMGKSNSDVASLSSEKLSRKHLFPDVFKKIFVTNKKKNKQKFVIANSSME